jgi:hypothetical protein
MGNMTDGYPFSYVLANKTSPFANEDTIQTLIQFVKSAFWLIQFPYQKNPSKVLRCKKYRVHLPSEQESITFLKAIVSLIVIF